MLAMCQPTGLHSEGRDTGYFQGLSRLAGEHGACGGREMDTRPSLGLGAAGHGRLPS